MNRFVFTSYEYSEEKATAYFRYAFEDGQTFKEQVAFKPSKAYNPGALDRALFLAFVLIGTSYYKTFPSHEVVMDQPLDAWQVTFFNHVYQEGLGQFAFENDLTRDDLAHFTVSDQGDGGVPTASGGEGRLVLQSGGKDSLLVASLMEEKGHDFTPWYLSSSTNYPQLLDTLAAPLLPAQRTIDRDALKAASEKGAKNGHVPITYIVQSLALIQAILLGKRDVLVSIAHEGEEAHDYIGDLAVTHQWSKTWQAEQDFAEYVTRYIATDMRVGSPLRGYSELYVAELFVQHAWKKYGHEFSSCNVANYQQGNDNSTLKWCGNCPKCANSYLLFAPFVQADDLKSLFNGQDLFAKPTLQRTFKGLLGIDGEPKPFECIGEIDELRRAYHMAQAQADYAPLSFDVPESDFDYRHTYDAQDWAQKMLQ